MSTLIGLGDELQIAFELHSEGKVLRTSNGYHFVEGELNKHKVFGVRHAESMRFVHVTTNMFTCLDYWFNILHNTKNQGNVEDMLDEVDRQLESRTDTPNITGDDILEALVDTEKTTLN